MKVYILPADVYGCGHHRLIWPADALAQQGFDVTILPPKGSGGSGFLAKVRDREDGTQQLVSTQVPADAEVVVIQRPGHPLQPQMVEIMRQNGIAVVVDMDDDMSAIHPKNVAFYSYWAKSPTPLSWRHALESCKRATLVTTSTRTLQKVYARHGRGVVLDNYLPAACLEYPKPETGRWGWAGTTQSHPNDLQVMRPAAQQLIDNGHEFAVVGAASRVKQAAGLHLEPSYTGPTGVADWVKTIANTYDVGVVPLAPTSFNTSKSRLKGIEHMAVGIPWVASPREEYRRLHRESGCGFLAEHPKQWRELVARLLTDEALRKEQAEMGRCYMVDQTYQAQAWRWMEAWERAYQMQRGG